MQQKVARAGAWPNVRITARSTAPNQHMLERSEARCAHASVVYVSLRAGRAVYASRAALSVSRWGARGGPRV